MLEVLQERNFPVTTLYAVASERSVGKQVEFKGKKHAVIGLQTAVDLKPDIAIFSAGGSTSREWAPKFAEAGTIVVDNSSAWRMDPTKKLIVPEINAGELEAKDRIIANPNCSTIQMLVALNPIYRAVGIERINVATYQAVSGAGRELVEDLANQTALLLNGRPLGDMTTPKQIAFNVLPQIDVWEDNGYSREEMKMVWETRKILDDPSIQVNPTAVRVPVFFGHSEAVHIETCDKITAAQARDLLAAAPGIVVLDSTGPGGYPTPVTEAAGTDPVYVGRIREDISHPRGLDLWVVADNVRKGAALNSVQIAELLVKDYL